MTSTEQIKDFSAFNEQPHAGQIVPEMFNDTGDDGSGYPGLQRAIFNRMTAWLHSGTMDSGLYVNGHDISGVVNLDADFITGSQIYSKVGLTGVDATITSITGTRGNFTTDVTGVKVYASTAFTGARGNFTTDLTGAQIYSTAGMTGVKLNVTNSITGVRANFTTDLTGAQGKFTSVSGTYISGAEITGTSGSIDDLKVNTFNMLPIGTVLMYRGSALGGTIATRTTQIGDEEGDTISMPGWFICNGESGTPDLIDKFIRSADAVGEEDGSDSITLAENQLPTHTVGKQSQYHQHNIYGGTSHSHNRPWVDGIGSDYYGWFRGATAHTNIVTSSESSHTHAMGDPDSDHNHTYTNADQQTIDNRPAFYSLIFIVRVS